MSGAGLQAEVCVIGGGPAGAALASRLAMRGHSVIVIERMRFPREHVGESIGPGIWPLLQSLVVREQIEAAAFARPRAALVRWESEEVSRGSAGVDGGLCVDRGAFDALLLERARSAGARILQPARALRARRAADGWQVPVSTRDRELTVRARYLVDASGRARALGGRRVRTSPPTVALHGTWRGVGGEGETRVEAQPQSWLWGAHLPGGRFRAMAFVEPETIRRNRRAGRDPQRLFLDLLARSVLFAELVEGHARLQGGVSVCDARCYLDERPVDAHSAKIGEAGLAIDPLSSSGVQTAVQAGLAASAAVATILCAEGDAEAAIAYLREHQRHCAEHHRDLAARSYGECAPFAAEPFWRRRAARPAQATAAAAPPPLEQLLPLRVRLHDQASLGLTPCVVGDRVQRRRALSHPALARPVAFLGGSELAPLLDRLRADRPLRQTLELWSASVSRPGAYAIAGWLAANGLIVPAG